MDPHLHRYRSLSAIYSIPAQALHASELIADWIASEVERPLLIGPDSESRQWVAAAADRIGALRSLQGRYSGNSTRLQKLSFRGNNS